jgi:hypothetical protein
LGSPSNPINLATTLGDLFLDSDSFAISSAIRDLIGTSFILLDTEGLFPFCQSKEHKDRLRSDDQQVKGNIFTRNIGQETPINIHSLEVFTRLQHIILF